MTHHNTPNNGGREPATMEPLMISVKEAARLLGLTSWSVYQLCDSGVLASGKHGKRRLVDFESVKAHHQKVLAGEAATLDGDAS